jgi:hypothetical protein
MNEDVFPIAACHLRGPAFHTVLGSELLILPKGGKCVERWLDLEDDIAAFTPIAAVWPTAWNEFLAMEMYHPIPAFARLHMDLNLVDEHGYIIHAQGCPGFLPGAVL